MRIQVRYENNRLDVFDTASFTKPEPFDGANMLTNFEVRVDALGNTGLWLMAHRYEISDAYVEGTQEGETPVARRKRGWRFLLAEASELESIEAVSIDGQTTLMRISGELADMVRFEQMCELWLPPASDKSITQRAVLLFDELCKAYPELSADASTVARMCGFSARAIDELRERTRAFETDEDEEDDWMEGFDCESFD
ncbi:hypothetical protein [Adlercreutzia sp. ZJ138]|uniref:hypothetical protein n=1 Tax=Adlercreutzia sp. ZJ138 TaxID=2709405 RepID=UPI0013EA6745|nr:hypothetical protein [Adlercreutzia sp. ZJ138]